MPKSQNRVRPKSWLWGWLTSIRLTVFLLLLLAAVAVIGTVLPQDEPQQYYLLRFGGTWGALFWRGGLSNIYFSIWFLAPITLLAVNILACIINGLPQAIKRTLRPFTLEKVLALPERGRFNWPAKSDPRDLVSGVLRRELGRTRWEAKEGQEVYFHSQGRFRPLGPYVVHLALLFILAGGLIGKFWGIEGRLPISQGKTAETFLVGDNHPAPVPLDFQVRLDRFQVFYYPHSMMPKEFRSDLTFLREGKEVEKAVCRVNEPVTFGGLTFYQASYGSEPAGPVKLKVSYKDQQETIEAPVRQLVDLPGGEGKIIIGKVEGNLQGYGPAVEGALITGQGRGGHELFMLLKDHPEMNKPVGPYHLVLEEAPVQLYSEFQVKRDPGVWWVYAGFLLFLPGFYLAFFRPPQRWAMVLQQTPKGGWQGRLLGASPRAREDFEIRLARLLEEFKKVKSS
jgi:cytochrome c biogenesis protein